MEVFDANVLMHLVIESSRDICSRRRTRCTVTTAPMGRRYTTLTAAASTV